MTKKNCIITKEHRQKISKANLGHLVSKETRKKIGKANKGCVGYWKNKKRKSFSKEWKNNMSKGMKGKKKAPFTKEHLKNFYFNKKYIY